MPLDLAALVVEAGAVSAEDMERALARQCEAGGALDTALLELGLLPEDEVVLFLSRASGLPPAPRDADEPDARARRVFPARVAERHGLAPFRLDGRELSLLATSPVDLAALDEIGFMLSLTLVPHVAPEWRVRALQARLYGVAMPARLAALGEAARATSPPSQEAQPASEAAAPPRDAEREAAPPDAPREGAFGVAPEEPLAAALAQAIEAAEAEVLRAGAPAPVADAPPRWTVDEAFAALARASGRDEVVSVALRYARDFFEAVALFAVARERLRGHDAAGWPGARERCRSVNLAARDAGLFRTVLGTGGPYLGPVVSADGNEALLAALGRASPRIALAYPIVLRDRTVAVLYADNGEAPVSPRRVGDLLLLLGGVGPAFERIVREAKRARGAPAAAPPPPRDEGAWEAREPARVEPAAPTPPPPDGDEYAVAKASEALAPAAPIDPAAAVDRLGATAPGSDERARLVRELVRAGPEGAAALAAAFPGPLDAAARRDAEALPVEERGPVLAALLALGPVATPYLVHLLQADDPERRRLAALLAGRAADPAAFMPLADAALDAAPDVAAAALDALAALRRHEEFHAVLERLRRSLIGGDEVRAARAAAALARLGDAGAVPLLVQSLDGPAPVAAAARAALEALTARRFADAPAWLAWWREHRDGSRADWIFSALEDEDRDVRLAAADVLRAAGPTAVRYFADAPPPERARSARAWRAFFEEQGYAL